MFDPRGFYMGMAYSRVISELEKRRRYEEMYKHQYRKKKYKNYQKNKQSKEAYNQCLYKYGFSNFKEYETRSIFRTLKFIQKMIKLIPAIRKFELWSYKWFGKNILFIDMFYKSIFRVFIRDLPSEAQKNFFENVNFMSITGIFFEPFNTKKYSGKNTKLLVKFCKKSLEESNSITSFCDYLNSLKINGENYIFKLLQDIVLETSVDESEIRKIQKIIINNVSNSRVYKICFEKEEAGGTTK